MKEAKDSFTALNDLRHTNSEHALTKLKQLSNDRVAKSDALVKTYHAQLTALRAPDGSGRDWAGDLQEQEEEAKALKTQLKAAKDDLATKDRAFAQLEAKHQAESACAR